MNRAMPRLFPERKYIGTGYDVLLQGFHWHAHRGAHGKSWYSILRDNAPAIRAAGFSWVWFPPASDSLAPQGYIPRRWYDLNTAYGKEGELRAAIDAMGEVKCLGDVVLNHRVGVATGGADFADPPFPDNRAAIVREDECGIGTGNHDTGERHPAGRDLDHTNPGVRDTIKQYLHRLRSIGFQGWRYDLVKGYAGHYTGEYNDATQPELAIGEFFDSDRQLVTRWLDSTGGKATAFDFPTRYILHDAFARDDYGRLRSHNNGRAVAGGLLGIWPSRAVTFIDNHDTEPCRDDEHREYNSCTRHFPGKTVDMGYAYTLTHPGIPCVFWSHFFDWGHPTRQLLERLLQVRQQAGLNARSGLDIWEARDGLYAAAIDNKVAMKLGHRSWSPGHGWHLAVTGERLAVWTR